MVICCKLIVALAAITHVSLHAVVSPGENIWQMVKDVGQQTDAIATLASGASGGCPNAIMQADITAGIYTISQPGYYCLSEDVAGTNSPMISIQSSNVVLDLDNHTMTGSGANNGVDLGLANLNNIAIYNGTIKTCFNGVVVSLGGTTVLFKQLKIFNAANHGIFVGGGTVKNIHVDGCSFINCSTAGFTANMGVAGPHNIVVENCYVSKTSSPAGFALIGVNTFYINNCVLNKGAFSCSGVSEGYIGNVIGFDDGAIQFFTGSSTVVNNCSWLGTCPTPSASYYFSGTNFDLLHSISINTGIRGVIATSCTNFTAKESVLLNSTTGVFNVASVGSEYYANIAHGNTTNYNGVTVTPVVTGPTATTSYWANVS